VAIELKTLDEEMLKTDEIIKEFCDELKIESPSGVLKNDK
jgi:hypothetical protein